MDTPANASFVRIAGNSPSEATSWGFFLAMSLVLGTLWYGLCYINSHLNRMALNSWRWRPAQTWDWPNEVAIVTGGCGGIGMAIVEKLVALDVTVAILDIADLPEGMDGHPHVQYYHCDVTDQAAVAATASAIRRDLGHPTILINNAGIQRRASVLQIAESDLRLIFDLNCLSLWFTTQQFLPHMILQNKGHVFTVASISSFFGLPSGAAYAASKAGAMAFHEVLAEELKHVHKTPDVLTTIVHPFFVRTPLINHAVKDLERAGLDILSAESVAEDIVSQLKKCESGQLILPGSKMVVSVLRSLPHWVQQIVRGTAAKSFNELDPSGKPKHIKQL